MSADQFTLRVARPADAEAVTAVLTSAYSNLMAPHYDAAVLAMALPSMTTANPGLLESGTYYVQVAPGGLIVSCGGWTHTEPGKNTSEGGVAHVRHFGTHIDSIRKGLGTAIFERCRQDVLATGVHTLRCFSSLGAESFYASLGFRTIDRINVVMGGRMSFPTVSMVWTDRPAAQK